MYDVWQFSIYEVSFSLSLIQLWYLIYNKKKKKKKHTYPTALGM